MSEAPLAPTRVRRAQAADVCGPRHERLSSGDQGTAKHPRRPGDAVPGDLFLQHFGQHGRDRRRDRGVEPVRRHRRRGRLGAFPADRRVAETADIPAAGAHPSVRHRPDDGRGQAFVRRRDPAEFRGGRSRPTQDGGADQCRCDCRRSGGQWRELPQDGDRQRNPKVHLRQGRIRTRRRSIWWCGPRSTRISRRRGSRR